GYTAQPGVVTALPLAITPGGAESAIESVTISGLPAGTLLSAGTSNGDGTAYTFDSAPPADLTMTLPAGASDFALVVEVTDEDGTASATQLVDLPQPPGGGGGGVPPSEGQGPSSEIHGTPERDVLRGSAADEQVFGYDDLDYLVLGGSRA